MTKRIIFSNGSGGVTMVIPSGEVSLDVVMQKDVPQGSDAEVIDVSELPPDRLFRNAWEKSGRAVVTNITKAKGIAHEKRRAARDSELAPLDIQATIPSQAAQAEAARQQIRDKYAAIQSQIDGAPDEQGLRQVMLQHGL